MKQASTAHHGTGDPSERWSAALAGWPDFAHRFAQEVSNSYSAPVGLTPRDAIWSLNKATLYRYRPTRPAGERYPTPILLVYALINKPYIFDLRPGQSFVEFMRDAGFDVYLLDWGVPGPEDRDTGLWDLTGDYLPRVIRKVLRTSGARSISMLGYCQGATMALAYLGAYPEAPVRNLVLLTAPVDFSKTQGDLFAAWFDRRFFDVDAFVDALGNLPNAFILHGSKMLKPVENYASTFTILQDKLGDEDAVRSWQVINRWTNDGQDLAGQVFRDWVKDLIWENKLVRGRVRVNGRRTDLGSIRAAVLNIIAEKDHIVPMANSAEVMNVVGSADKQQEIISSGHVGLMASRGARYKLWPKVSAWLGARSGLDCDDQSASQE